MSRLTTLIGHTEPLPPSLTDPENHGMREFFQPAAKEGETILLQEPGRVIGAFRGKEASFGFGVCYRSHCFALIDLGHRYYAIRVRHGGGVEDVKVNQEFPLILLSLESDARFLLMYQVYKAANEARQSQWEAVSSRYQRAFLQGRLKKVKARGQKGRYNAEILPFDVSLIGVSISLYGIMASDTRRETYTLAASGRAACSSIEEAPGFKVADARNANIEVIYAAGKETWVLGADRLDLDVWRSARELGLLEALATVLIRELDSDGRTGEAFRNPRLALEALKFKVSA